MHYGKCKTSYCMWNLTGQSSTHKKSFPLVLVHTNLNCCPWDLSGTIQTVEMQQCFSNHPLLIPIIQILAKQNFWWCPLAVAQFFIQANFKTPLQFMRALCWQLYNSLVARQCWGQCKYVLLYTHRCKLYHQAFKGLCFWAWSSC